MSFLTIDTSSAATSKFFDQLTQLEGVQYLFEFIWSDRETCWYLNVNDQNENPIASGVKLVVSWPILRRFRDPRLPKGTLLCLDTTGNGQDIASPEELGQRVLLSYITSDEVL